MLLKPCSGPSIKYMTVPRSTEMINIKNTKMKILALLALRARSRLLDSPTKRTNFNILKIRSSLRALKAVMYCEPTTKNDRYLGIVESKSTTPKKLKIYLLGFLMQIILKIYSMVKKLKYPIITNFGQVEMKKIVLLYVYQLYTIVIKMVHQ